MSGAGFTSHQRARYSKVFDLVLNKDFSEIKDTGERNKLKKQFIDETVGAPKINVVGNITSLSDVPEESVKLITYFLKSTKTRKTLKKGGKKTPPTTKNNGGQKTPSTAPTTQPGRLAAQATQPVQPAGTPSTSLPRVLFGQAAGTMQSTQAAVPSSFSLTRASEKIIQDRVDANVAQNTTDATTTYTRDTADLLTGFTASTTKLANDLTTTDTDLQQKLSDAQQKVTDKNNDLTTVQADMANLTATITDLQTEISELKKKIENQKTDTPKEKRAKKGLLTQLETKEVEEKREEEDKQKKKDEIKGLQDEKKQQAAVVQKIQDDINRATTTFNQKKIQMESDFKAQQANLVAVRDAAIQSAKDRGMQDPSIAQLTQNLIGDQRRADVAKLANVTPQSGMNVAVNGSSGSSSSSSTGTTATTTTSSTTAPVGNLPISQLRSGLGGGLPVSANNPGMDSGDLYGAAGDSHQRMARAAAQSAGAGEIISGGNTRYYALIDEDQSEVTYLREYDLLRAEQLFGKMPQRESPVSDSQADKNKAEQDYRERMRQFKNLAVGFLNKNALAGGKAPNVKEGDIYFGPDYDPDKQSSIDKALYELNKTGKKLDRKTMDAIDSSGGFTEVASERLRQQLDNKKIEGAVASISDSSRRLQINPEFPYQANAMPGAGDMGQPNPGGLGGNSQVESDRRGGLFGTRVAGRRDETQVNSDMRDEDGTGDFLLNNLTQDRSYGTLRPRFGLAGPEDVIPSTIEQLQSDIRFDMFDTVAPGYGEGMDNKLFLLEKAREGEIDYASPMFSPGSYIGPVCGLTVPPWQWQRVIQPNLIQSYQQQVMTRLDQIQQVLRNNGEKTTNVVCDDVGFNQSVSASHLKRDKLSPFEPVIRTDIHWRNEKTPTGLQLNRKRFRVEHDALRMPRKIQATSYGTGGPTTTKRRALEVILP